MTGVDADLATLLDVADEMNSPRMRAVVKRVEAELSRLQEELQAAEARCARLEAERNEYAERLQWLRDLREREGSWGKPYERAMAASAPSGGEPYECEEERDQLAARCARLESELRSAMGSCPKGGAHARIAHPNGRCIKCGGSPADSQPESKS